jgi:alkyl hydroperoxide reductase subunit AhpC
LLQLSTVCAVVHSKQCCIVVSCSSLCSGLFIIAPDGTLRQKTVNDLPVGRSVDETLRLVKAFQVRQ